MGAQWDKAKASALKILGDQGDVPDMAPPVATAHDNFDKAFDALNKSREDCEAKLLALENANDSVRNAMKQFLATIEKNDLGLDSKNKADLVKIQKARRLLIDALNGFMKGYEKNDKIFDELDKHVIQMGNYKPPPGP